MPRRPESDYRKRTEEEQEQLELERMCVKRRAKENPKTVVRGMQFGCQMYYNPEASEDREHQFVYLMEEWTDIADNGLVEEKKHTVRRAVVNGEAKERSDRQFEEVETAEELALIIPLEFYRNTFVNDWESAFDLFNSYVPDGTEEEQFHAEEWDGYEDAVNRLREEEREEQEAEERRKRGRENAVPERRR